MEVYHLVMTVTVRHGFSMALIEIDGLPGFTVLNSMVIFHGYVNHIAMVFRWPIEIDGLPGFTVLNSMVIFHGYVNQMVNNWIK